MKREGYMNPVSDSGQLSLSSRKVIYVFHFDILKALRLKIV